MSMPTAALSRVVYFDSLAAPAQPMNFAKNAQTQMRIVQPQSSPRLSNVKSVFRPERTKYCGQLCTGEHTYDRQKQHGHEILDLLRESDSESTLVWDDEAGKEAAKDGMHT